MPCNLKTGNDIRMLLLASLCLLLASEGTPTAQATVFTDETADRLPQWVDISHDADFGDVDNDNDPDIVVSNSRSENFDVPNHILLNDGNGHFSQDTSWTVRVSEFSHTALGDIERDGDLDIFIAVDNNWNRLFVKDDHGDFLDESDDRLPDKVSPWRSDDAVFGDVDGDMTLDFVVANFGNQRNLLRLNDGDGYFAGANDQFPSGHDNSSGVVSADVDADFDIDVYVTNASFGDGDKLMMNDGDGFFTDVSGIQIPQDDNATWGAAFGDVDTDGDFDLVIANSFFASNRIFVNRGDGYFDDRTGDLLPLDSAESLQMTFGDIDNDGDLDLLVANYASGGTSNELYINDGSGRFADSTALYLPVEETETDILVFGDVDRDGDLDIFECNHAQNRLLINNSTPDSFPPTIPRTYHHPDTGDTTNPYLITTTVWDNISIVIGELDVSLFYRTFSDTSSSPTMIEFTEIPMVDCGGFLYREKIPAQSSLSTVEYYIKAEDKMGNISLDPPNAPDSVYSFLVDVNVGFGDDPPSMSSLPKAFSLAQNYPNPFNPSTTVTYNIPEGEEGNVIIEIFDIRGRLVRSLVQEEKNSGTYSVHWDGRNDRGEKVGSGAYLCRMKAREFISIKKMTVAR